ncbi:MAG TPA: hydroxysqualene dehydroxylase HpnE [Clostridia bacterium]|nr:hydroxysqualene dehydroxylase HpnE [Clostridia bacterium]
MSSPSQHAQRSAHQPQAARVAVIGGGLSGLAAACALADTGYHVSLFERRPYLGGRASSYQHPGTGEVVDNCQHVLLGCCTNLLDFYRRLGVEGKIRWFRRITFIEPGGRRGTLEPAGIPAPFHSSLAFLRYPLLSMRDKFGVARAMLAFMDGVPKDASEQDFLGWLRHHGQTQRAIDRFWTPVLVSALNEELDRVSVYYGAMVFRDAFLKSAEAGRMGIPTVPLSELYGVAADYIRARGGQVHLRASVESFSPHGECVRITVDGRQLEFDYAVPAVPFNVLARLLPEGDASADLRSALTQFDSSPITGVHLWFDREVTELEHAVLLDRNIQWMFNKSKLLAGRVASPDAPLAAGSYLELVVSSSKSMVEMSRQNVIELAIKELAEFFPAVKEARLLKGTVIKEVHATFAPTAISELHRPQPQSAWSRIFLSGDWTATGWPATMEGAVRGGYASAEVLTRAAGSPKTFLVPDLPARGLMRLFKD